MPNPSFEEIENCPHWPTYLGFQSDSKPRYWEKWAGSPDYFTTCLGSSDTLAGVPNNLFGSQFPLDGDAYVGGWTYGNFGNEFREHIGVELIEPLVVGEQYYLSFWVTTAEGRSSPPSTPGWAQPVFWAANNIGLLFTMNPNIWTGFSGPEFLPRNYAHLHAVEIIADTANWVLVEGSFHADSAYHFLAIGNFFENARTDTVHLTPGQSSGAYSFVDAVCVTSSPGGCDFGGGFDAVEDDDVAYLYPNPTSQRITIKARMKTGALWQVTDALGREQARGIWMGIPIALDVNSWASGAYQFTWTGQHSSVRLVVLH